jgi:hypothetical protein
MGTKLNEIQTGVEYKVQGTTYSSYVFDSLTRYKNIGGRWNDRYVEDAKGMYIRATNDTFVHVTKIEKLWSEHMEIVESQKHWAQVQADRLRQKNALNERIGVAMTKILGTNISIYSPCEYIEVLEYVVKMLESQIIE